MPDLSNLLGAVYGEEPTSPDAEDQAPVKREPAADERGPAVPDWADDEHLDAAFAQWKPGPSADASAAEHELVGQTHDDPPPPLPDDLAAALSEALVATSARRADAHPSATDHADDADGAADADTDADDEHAVTDAFALPALSQTQVATSDQDDDAVPLSASDHTGDIDNTDVGHAVALPSLSPQRAAAAELTAASRVDPEPASFAPPHEPAPAAVIPVAPAVVPEPASAPAPEPAARAEMPPGTRRWDRSDDDILPEKRSRGFFSFSLRRG